MGLHVNGDTTAGTSCGLQVTTTLPSATYSACVFLRIDSVVVDTDDLPVFQTYTGVSLGTNGDGLISRAGSAGFAAGQKMIAGVWWFLGFSTDTARTVLYSGPVAGGGLVRTNVTNAESSAPTSIQLGGGGTITGNSNPIATFAHAKIWGGAVLSPSDFEHESRQRFPARPGAWLYWPLTTSSDVTDRIQGKILVKIATALRAMRTVRTRRYPRCGHRGNGRLT